MDGPLSLRKRINISVLCNISVSNAISHSGQIASYVDEGY